MNAFAFAELWIESIHPETRVVAGVILGVAGIAWIAFTDTFKGKSK